MRGLIHTCLWLVAITCIACSAVAETNLRLDPNPAWQNADNVQELAEILETWLDNHMDYRRADVPPRIKLINPSTAASLRGNSGRDHGRTRGLYDPQSSTIYLIQPWDLKDANDVSVLLHELVHSRQMSQYYYCRGAQEEVAYRLQDAWLRARGLRANVNWIGVILEAGCTPRDIHPD